MHSRSSSSSSNSTTSSEGSDEVVVVSALKKEMTADMKVRNRSDSAATRYATIKTSTYNLTKSLIGAGLLSLPGGVAFVTDNPDALIPSSILCILFGLAAAYSFTVIGKVCGKHDCATLQAAWGRTVDPRTAGLITAITIAPCFLITLSYNIIIADTFSALFHVSQFDLLMPYSIKQNKPNFV